MATVLTDVGEAITTGRVKGSATLEPNHAAWGTGTNTAAKTDTSLQTESAEARVEGTSSLVNTGSTNDTYQVVATIQSASTQTITEAGLFDEATSGQLYLRGDFTGIPVDNGDSIEFTFKVQYT